MWKLGELLKIVTESVVPILKCMPDTMEKGELLLERNVFEVLVGLLDQIGKIEQYLMWSWINQAVNTPRTQEKWGRW